MESLFIEMYKEVFDTEGNVKNCGRVVCQQLITLANSLGKKLGEPLDFGNAKTGFVNVENMRKLYMRVQKG